MYQRQPAVYILANQRNGTLYTGVTSDLIKRIYVHKYSRNKKSFTNRYHCNQLVYFEQFEDMYNAIAREKQIKGGARKDKLTLIEKMNPAWKDLYEGLL